MATGTLVIYETETEGVCTGEKIEGYDDSIDSILVRLISVGGIEVVGNVYSLVKTS